MPGSGARARPSTTTSAPRAAERHGRTRGVAEELAVPESLAGERVDRAVALLTGWSRREVQDLVEAGSVLVDGRIVAKSRRLVRDDVVQVLAEPAPPGRPQPEPSIPVTARYEDRDLAVVAKPAGLVVHPGAGHPRGTLVNGLLARYPEIADVGDPARPGIVHRLDRDTSGVLVVARTADAYAGLVRMLAEHEVEREYRALVWGHPAASHGVIDAPIGRSVRRPTRMAVREGGRLARTHYDVVAAYGEPEVALLDCRLETGRTHQIRVHLQAIGHPVFGDAAYSGVRPALTLDRPFLHAGALAFAHPITGTRVAVTEELAPELSEVLAGLR
jgi:23S rRNA pseudouridine1911/1915/1917 synthase